IVVLAAAQIGVQADAPGQVKSQTAAEALKQVLLQEPGGEKLRIEGRQESEVVVARLQGDPGFRLIAKREKATAQTGPARLAGQGIAVKLVGFQIVIERKCALERNRCFKKDELAVGMPVNARNGRTRGNAVFEGIVTSVIPIDERAGHLAIRIVIPSGRIGR